METKEVLIQKAKFAQIIYDDLVSRFNIDDLYPTTFIANIEAENILKKNYLTQNPFPLVVKPVLAKLRRAAVDRLFMPENVLQTPILAAVLSLCSNVATSIGKLRGDDTSGTQIDCDIAFAGLQAIRLYMVDQDGSDLRKSRLASALRVKNAYNGSFYKYPTKDNRYVSFHVYYQSQQERLNKALNTGKPSNKFTMISTRSDIRRLSNITKKSNALELERLAFDCQACGCMLRSRDEWDKTDVGQAVNKMPLIRFEETGKKEIPNFGALTDKGPLSGIKVLDLTHIIAGPACSRVLAEYGADVLLVRRGKLVNQEQAMLELDGWAGKHAINLDLNKAEDLAKMKELIKQADVITYSYQDGVFDKFGLSIDEIRKLNPNVIYSHLMCFSDSVWRNLPGWAPCAEDITGLSVRNGTLEHPVNLNGVPLDYIPGFFLALGTLLAIKQKLVDGTTYQVTTSLTRGAVYLHEATDLCAKESKTSTNTKLQTKANPYFKDVRTYITSPSLGKIGFPYPATYNSKYNNLEVNMICSDENTGFECKK